MRKKGGGHTQQISMDDSMRNAEYDAFVEKFKPKLTTDDCYTPENVYEAVKAWVLKHYDIDQSAQVVRPFWPGADYKREAYPEGRVVIDNPPFSIISEIEQWYMKNGIRFFLFAPALTIFKPYDGLKYVLVDVNVTYENGAKVPLSFVTNMGVNVLETAPDLDATLRDINKANEGRKPQQAKYELPAEVATASAMRKLARNGVKFCVPEGEAVFARSIDSMRQEGKEIYGGGMILTENATRIRIDAERVAEENAEARKQKPIVWRLSETEKAMWKRPKE